jgi:hypothetical protein
MRHWYKIWEVLTNVQEYYLIGTIVEVKINICRR